MKGTPIIRNIGWNEKNVFGYDIQNQEIYQKIIPKDNAENILKTNWKVGGIAPVLGTILYVILYNFHNCFPTWIWLILSTISLIILMFVCVKLGVFLTEHFVNQKKFEKLTILKNLTPKEKETLKNLKGETAATIFVVFLAIAGTAGAIPLGNLYITSSDMNLWGIYIMSCLLANAGLYLCWYVNRGKRLRQKVIKQIELSENTEVNSVK